jgi:hypothetical protein
MSDSNSDVRIFIAKRDLTQKGLSGTSDDERGTLIFRAAGVAKSDSNIDQFCARVRRCLFATNHLSYSGPTKSQPNGLVFMERNMKLWTRVFCLRMQIAI